MTVASRATRAHKSPTFEQFTAIRRYQPTIAFSPDGSEVAYSVNTSGQFNLWRQSSAGGFPHQVTLSNDQAVRSVTWSPDGAQLCFTADNQGDEFTRVYTVPPRGGEPEQIVGQENVQYTLGFGQNWSPDGRYMAYAGNDNEPTDQDVSIYELATGERRRVLAGGMFFPSDWSPDGTQLLAVQMHSNTNFDTHLIDVASGTSQLLTEHEGESKYLPIGWAANGSGFYLLTDEGREFMGLALYDLATKTWEWRETPEWDVESAAISANGRRLAWSVNEDGYSRLWMRDLSDGSDPVRLDMPDGVLLTGTLSRAGDRLALLWEQARYPTEVFVIDLPNGDVTQLTNGALGGVEERDLTPPELVRYPTFDGRQIPAFLYRPTEPTGKLPVLLSIHGGPEAQERPRYLYAGLYQYLASRGIAVLAPNVRGSTGYGKSYQKLIHRDWGGDELKDFEATVNYLKSLDWVDPDRIGIYGGSFGGFAVLSCISRLPEHWAAAVDLVGPSNLVTLAKSVPPTWRRMITNWLGDPEADADFLMERSPVTYADQITAPLFVIQGANDPRVVKAESDQIVERLRNRGVEVRYDVYEDEGHGFTKRENELRAYRDMAGFLEQYLLPAEA